MNERNDPQGSPIEDDRYRLLVEAVTDYAIFMLDVRGFVVSWNSGAERFKGYAPAEIIGQHFSRFYTDEDRRAGVPERALHTAATEGRFETEGWRVRKDGTQFWALVVLDPITDPQGSLIGFAKVTKDLTARRTAEQALRRSEEQFRLLVQGVTDYAIYMLDPEGRVSSWNLGAQRIKGYLPEEIIGQHFSRFYTSEDKATGEPAKALAAARRDGRFEKEGWRIRKDGTRFRANVVIDAIRNDDGTLIGYAKVTRDVTARNEVQQALEKAREALFQSQKLEAIGQLTGGVAHDFNNLLMAIAGSLELLRKRLPPEDARSLQLLDNAVQGTQRGASLTQRMLAFARRQDLAAVPVEVATLIHGMAALLQRSLGPQIAVALQFPLGLPRVSADPNQLELALLNLAVNARDAMPAGGALTISAEPHAIGAVHPTGLPAGFYVRIAVADQGDGMDDATLAHAIEPFFTTKGVGKGTGLGLSMVQGMAEQLGGRLLLSSRPGKGTTAEIWLPVAANVEPVAAPAPAPRQDTRPLVILAVDDDALVLMNTTAMLEDLGHRVLEASSGKQALAILARGEPVDLIVTDQAMPQLTGLRLIEMVRADRPGLPAILATGYAELPPGTETPLVKLDKPFLEADLARAVAEALANPLRTGGAGMRPPSDRIAAQ